MEDPTMRRLQLWLIATVLATVFAHAQEPAELTHKLTDFGPATTRAEAEATFAKALRELEAAGGGVLVVPADTPADAVIENSHRWSHSVNPQSNKLTDWQIGPAVTVIDLRGGDFHLRVPQLTRGHSGGVILDRVMRLADGDSLQHWTEEGVLSIENKVIHGPCNYLDWIVAPVKAGPDARFYLPQVRNIFPGMYLNAHEGPGYGGRCERITVKTVGFDPEKKLHFFTAHTNIDHQRGAIVQNKSHVPALRIDNDFNAANQTWDFFMTRNQYANGDSEMFHATFNYMGNVHSMAGDENGNVIVGHMKSRSDVFRATVARIDNAAGELVFKAARNAHTLGNSRPLINLNPEKWVSAGTVMIVPAESYWDTVDTGKYPFDGKTYPTTVAAHPGSGVKGLRMGGLIRGSADCPWDERLIGRFFAVDEKVEYVPSKKGGAVRRWYEITGVSTHDDGTRDLTIKRYWWGAKDAGSPTLYNSESYSYDGHLRPLKYVIAPGGYVNNLSRAVGGEHQRGGIPPYTLGIVAGPHTGTDVDFAAGDPIVQAVGPDPFKPQFLRGWAFDSVPGAWPAAMIDLANHGATARHSALVVQGGPATLEACSKRQENRPAWDHGIRLATAMTVGIAVEQDMADAAILFKQPNHEQTIKWQHGPREAGKPVAASTLQVSTETGHFAFAGGAVEAQAGVLTTGLSGGKTPARNLRGLGIPVDQGATTVQVTFAEAEADGQYAVFIEQSWLANRAVTRKGAAGFTVSFAEPAPAGATIDWMLVR
jgi:hypothetical protein